MVDQNIKVSVIIPLYNSETYLDIAVESVINQTYKNLEIILIDDGSIDKTYEKAFSFAKRDNRITVIRQSNSGPGIARNKALDMATGEYICFVDSDDRIALSAIETMVNSMDNDCDLVQCRACKVFDDNRKDTDDWADCEKKISGLEAMRDYLLSSYPIVRFAVWGKLIRKSAIDTIRFPEIKNSEDVVFTAYLIDKCNQIKYIPDILYYVSVRNGSLSRKPITKERIEAGIICNQMISDLIIEKSKYTNLLSRAYWSSAITIINFACEWKKERNSNLYIKELSKICGSLDYSNVSIPIKKKAVVFSFVHFPCTFVKIVNLLKK